MDQGSIMMWMWWFMLFFLLVIIFLFVILWKIFTKAWEDGWKCLIPIYNTIVLLKIAGKPWWWVLLMFIPIVSIVVLIIVSIELVKKFGKGTAFGIGFALFFPIFGAILAFWSAEYTGTQAVSTEWWEDKLY